MNIWGTNGPRASLHDVLEQRELRADRQRQMLRSGPCLVSFCMNLPGEHKTFPLAAAGFREGLLQIEGALSDKTILDRSQTSTAAGEEALLLVDALPEEIKVRMIGLESSHPLGRLWDIDVLDQGGRSLSRQAFGHSRRICLLCDRDAKLCGRSQAHAPEDLFARAVQILDDHFRETAAKTVAGCVAYGMLQEVSATPKPGLVDRANNGSHRDMDYSTFLASISALEPFFEAFFTLGWQHHGASNDSLFSILRAEGRKAEQAMFRATSGVNTHKGMIFSAAILCGALGRLHSGIRSVTLAQLQEECADLGQCALADFASDSRPTAGLRCYAQQQVLGIRGEAAAGFPAAVGTALPALQDWKRLGTPLNDAALFSLIHLIARVDDTNMIHRGGWNEALNRKKEAQILLPTLTEENITAQLTQLDASYTASNLSPGGCADLLSIALTLDRLIDQGLVS